MQSIQAKFDDFYDFYIIFFSGTALYVLANIWILEKSSLFHNGSCQVSNVDFMTAAQCVVNTIMSVRDHMDSSKGDYEAVAGKEGHSRNFDCTHKLKFFLTYLNRATSKIQVATWKPLKTTVNLWLTKVADRRP